MTRVTKNWSDYIVNNDNGKKDIQLTSIMHGIITGRFRNWQTLVINSIDILLDCEIQPLKLLNSTKLVSLDGVFSSA